MNAPVGETFRGDAGVPYEGVTGDYDNVAPRVGFAYDLTGDGKTSIRGGGGYFYDQRVSGIINNGGVDASPWSARVSYTTPCEQGPLPPRATCFAAPYVGAALPDPFPAQLGAATAVFPTPVLVTTYSPQWKTTLAYNYNLTLEHQIGAYVVRSGVCRLAHREWIAHVGVESLCLCARAHQPPTRMRDARSSRTGASV